MLILLRIRSFQARLVSWLHNSSIIFTSGYNLMYEMSDYLKRSAWDLQSLYPFSWAHEVIGVASAWLKENEKINWKTKRQGIERVRERWGKGKEREKERHMFLRHTQMQLESDIWHLLWVLRPKIWKRKDKFASQKSTNYISSSWLTLISQAWSLIQQLDDTH